MTRIRFRTLDREATPVLTSEQLGPKRARTPEGFLLCLDVPVARVGRMIYGDGEIPLEAGRDGTITVTRGEDELFAPTALASYQGKPVVDDHPDDDVRPDNWKKLSIGVVLNPRRGDGDDSDVMLADLLITDHSAIRDVEAGKREVSAGYEADYEQTGPGEGRQTNIIGNHVALVEKGRCGPRCAIGDHQPKELQGMGTKTTTVRRRAAIADSIRKAFKDAEQGMLDAMGDGGLDDDDESGSGDTHIHIHADGSSGAAGEPSGAPAGGDPTQGAPTQDDPVEARFQAIEQTLAQIMEKLGGTQDEGGTPDPTVTDPPPAEEEVKATDGMPEEVEAAMKAKTNDSAALQTSFQAVMADAEVLVPGFRFPTFDSKAKRKATMDSMCQVRRQVITHLATTNDGATLLNAFSGGSNLDPQKATCVEVATVFRAAAGAKKLLNNSAGTRDASRVAQPGLAGRRTMTPADLNKLHAEHYAGKAH